MAYECRIERDSISHWGHRLTTFVSTFPRIVLAEFNTHRMLSRNSASSRAIPVKRQIERVHEDTFYPIFWGKNQKGMQASEELPPTGIKEARDDWWSAKDAAVKWATILGDPNGLDVHKQITNRLLEPFMWHTAVVTATEWSNFFNLRDNKHAQPEIREIAHMMKELYEASDPRACGPDDWHLPFVDFDDEISEYAKSGRGVLPRVSAARSARVSYLTHDGVRDMAKDLELYDKLVGPGHMSPLEHPARPMTEEEHEFTFSQKKLEWEAGHWSWNGAYTHFCGNFNGWVQLRKMIPGEHDILAAR